MVVASRGRSGPRTGPPDVVPDWAALDRRGPFGGRNVGLEIGGLRVRASGLSAPQVAWCRERFGVFAADGERRAPDLQFAVRRAPASGFLQLDPAAAPETYRMEMERDGDRLRCWSYRFAGWFRAGRGDGSLAIADETGRGFEASLENFLRVLYATLVLPRGGFLLHSACLVHEGRAHLMFGPSGAGKTTTTRLAAGVRVLSDDLTLVLPRRGVLAAVSVPFRGHYAELPPAQVAFPVAGWYRLIQSREVRLERLPDAWAVSELAASLPFVTGVRENLGAVLDVLGRAVRQAPAYRLHFRKDPAFWELITAGPPGGPAAGGSHV